MIVNARDICDSIPLIEVISRYVDLKKEGSGYSGKSPWSKDTTASFKVQVRKGIYKCFSTGKGGNNAASFIMDVEDCTYPEALVKLAALTGTVVQYANGATGEAYIKASKEKRDNQDKMHDALNSVHKYYRDKTVWPENGEVAGKYYSPEARAKWELCIAGDSHDLDRSSTTWTERSAMIDAGLLAESKRGTGYYDFFHSRLLFPLRGAAGQLIGYNARALSWAKGDKHPKYLNSKESIVYSKAQNVFGYTQNWKEISRLSIARLVEGPTDVIQLDMAGVGNAVSASGTAFSLDQAKVIAQAADMIIIMLDGDDPGQKKTSDAVQVALQAQMEVKVQVLPDNLDPSDYIAKNGKDALEQLQIHDGIEWCIRYAYPKVDDLSPTEKAGALLLARQLIALVHGAEEQAMYCQTICKIIGVTATVLKSAVKDFIQEKADSKSKLTAEQELMKTTYGVYIDNNKYRDYHGAEISNFIIKPLFLVSYHGSATRVYEIINKFGASRILNQNSDEFITLMGFRRATEMLGAFIFKGNDAQFTKIREWIYNDMKSVTPIETLGYQPRSNIYAWANGITIPGTSQVIEVDEYGLVDHKVDDQVITYFLPAESKVNVKNDEDTDRELESNFKWMVPSSGSRAPKDLSGWSAGFAKLFGANAAVALCWLMAAVHRDLLHSRYDMFPHLNLFGPAGSGKTFMAQIITSIFGKPMRAVHLVSSTPVAFYRKIAQTRNAIIWYEEYSEKVTPDKQEALKNFADGFGRVTGQMTNNNKTKATPVLNACIISGQILPSHDPALLERCETLFFDKFYGDKKSAQYAEEFKAWSNSGVFAFVAAEIFSYREYVADKWVDKMEAVRDLIRDQFTPSTQPSDRVLNNFAMTATVYLIIGEKVKLPFSITEIIDTIIVRIMEQSKAVEGADELSGFWMVIEYLITRGHEINGQGLTADHFAVEYHKSVTIKVSESETKQVTFDYDSKLMFIRLNHAHSLYVREGKSMVSRVVEKGTLMHYMKQHRSWVGEMKAKKINDKPQRCLVFNLEYLTNYEFECTDYRTVTQPQVTNESKGIEFQFPEDGKSPF